MNVRWIAGSHSGTGAKRRSPKVNPDLMKLNFARLAIRTGATKILAELRQSRSLAEIASNLVSIEDRKNSMNGESPHRNFSG